MIRRLLTKNKKEIPLLWIMFNEKHFDEHGEKDSCVVHLHPTLNKDDELIMRINRLVDYIRDNHDMKELF